jgi:hypothetical protein
MYVEKIIRQMSIQDYNLEVRPNLKDGDFMFGSGNYVFSQLVKKMTKSMWSHVGIIFRFEEIDRVLLLESVENAGVRFAPLSKYLRDYRHGRPYNGLVFIARYEEQLQDKNYKIMNKTGCDALAWPYSWVSIAMALGRILTGSRKFGRENLKEHNYTCAELVEKCFSSGGIKFRKSGYITPEDFARDPSVSFLYRLL